MSPLVELTIKCLTAAALTGLLLATGLRLTFHQIGSSLRQWPMLLRVVLVNFFLVPALTFAAIRCFDFPVDLATGMMILAAAPFAPVVPVFAKMCRGDLALAAALTGLFPFASAFITPLLCEKSLHLLHQSRAIEFDFLKLLLVLCGTITLPLLVGLSLRHWLTRFAIKLLRPVDVISEAIGAASLAFVSWTEWPNIVQTAGSRIGIMAGIFAGSALLGWLCDWRHPPAARVLALGAANRNIALALLIAAQQFADTPILPAVVANGLLMILMGLLLTGWWRLIANPQETAPSPLGRGRG